jgi:hypothetical protein
VLAVTRIALPNQPSNSIGPIVGQPMTIDGIASRISGTVTDPRRFVRRMRQMALFVMISVVLVVAMRVAVVRLDDETLLAVERHVQKTKL